MKKIYDNDDLEELKKMGAEDWMINAIMMNPDYTGWAPGDDYMTGSGWAENYEYEDWKDFQFGLDDLNEVVNFYFDIVRNSENCEYCEGEGYNPETREIHRSWYDFEKTGKRWCHNITQDEVDALWEKNRLKHDFKEKPTADQVNEWSRHGMGHDAINRWICCETRAKRLGVYGFCDKCEERGYNYTEPKPHVELVLWILHPRKGCAKGLTVRNVSKEDFNDAISFLKEAQERNHDRFSKLKEM